MANYSVETLLENFQFIGLTPEDSVLAKCFELCATYNINEEDLVDRWAAFTISNLKNAAPSLEGLELMERKELSKTPSASTAKTPKKTKFNKDSSTYQSPKTPKVNTETHVEVIHDECSQPLTVSQVGEFSQRKGAGKVVFTLGQKPIYQPSKKPVCLQVSNGMSHSTMQMFCPLKKQRQHLASITEKTVQMIAKKYSVVLPDHFTRDSLEDTFYGRIVCEGEGKLNDKSALLELPFSDYAKGERVPLNLSKLPAYSLFPNQNVIIQGKMVKGTINVTNIHSDGFVSPIQSLKLEPLQIVVACGPFTIQNNLRYEPLQELLQIVVSEQPDILLLTGPFLDAEHESVASLTEDYDVFFENLLESIMTPLQGLNTQVVLVANAGDAFHFAVFPTPPYETTLSYPNLLCVSDPCTLNVNGFVIGVTTVDPIFALAKEEITYPAAASDRMSNLSKHLLNQLSFFPLQSAQLPIDHELMDKYGLMETSPHLLIVPSNFKHFAKKINGCTIMNPERLVKGYSGGNYARINVTCKEYVNVSAEIIAI